MFLATWQKIQWRAIDLLQVVNQLLGFTIMFHSWHINIKLSNRWTVQDQTTFKRVGHLTSFLFPSCPVLVRHTWVIWILVCVVSPMAWSDDLSFSASFHAVQTSLQWHLVTQFSFHNKPAYTKRLAATSYESSELRFCLYPLIKRFSL